MTELDELISRLEKATGPDARLDTDIMIALGQWTHRDWWSFDYQKHTPANLTSSLDAAIALADKVLPGAWYHVAKGKTRTDEPLYGAALMFFEEPIGQGETDASAAAALCVAILKALKDRP
ncbi:hypothetical protein [Ensifer adhaerens]|uniref:hypothetical protein n=1 Tax=Ensifer adhaerens TaxID=106592 RepID=UPI000CF135F3|nr:hypothetical protein [Ensifer adhaerens]